MIQVSHLFLYIHRSVLKFRVWSNWWSKLFLLDAERKMRIWLNLLKLKLVINIGNLSSPKLRNLKDKTNLLFQSKLSMIQNILIVSNNNLRLDVLEDLNYLPEEAESYALKLLKIVSILDFSRPFQQLDICYSHQWEDQTKIEWACAINTFLIKIKI